MKCTQVARTQIATKYALLLFAQTLVILIANPFYERKFILRSRTTTGVSNCAIDIQQDLINLHISVLRMTIRILYSKLILSINYVCSMIYSLLFCSEILNNRLQLNITQSIISFPFFLIVNLLQ